MLCTCERLVASAHSFVTWKKSFEIFIPQLHYQVCMSLRAGGKIKWRKPTCKQTCYARTPEPQTQSQEHQSTWLTHSQSPKISSCWIASLVKEEFVRHISSKTAAKNLQRTYLLRCKPFPSTLPRRFSLNPQASLNHAVTNYHPHSPVWLFLVPRPPQCPRAIPTANRALKSRGPEPCIGGVVFLLKTTMINHEYTQTQLDCTVIVLGVFFPEMQFMLRE